MEGVARNWFLSESFQDWEQFIQKFRRTFIREPDRWEALNKRVQGRGEALVDYFYDKVCLCRALKLSFLDFRDYVIQGIWNKELAQFILARIHVDEPGLLSDMQEWNK